MKTLIATTVSAAALLAGPALAQTDNAPETSATFGTELGTTATIYTDDNDRAASETEGMNYRLSKIWDEQVLGNDMPDEMASADQTIEPYAVASTEETDTVTEYGVGGPYYESEADVARDAVLTEPTIAEVAMADPQFSTLTMLTDRAGLTDELMSEGPVTVFAPTNAAFDKLDEQIMDGLESDPAMLETVLKAHIVPGSHTIAEIPMNESELQTQGDTVLKIRKDADGLLSADASIVQQPDIIASNGVIHVVDEVIIPEDDTDSVLR